MKSTFEQFITEASKLKFDPSTAEPVSPFKFGNHTIPQGTTSDPSAFKMYKVPFDLTKLSPTTAKNVLRFQEEHGYTFEDYMYIVTVNRGFKRKWSYARNKYIELMEPDIAYSYYLPGKTHEGEEIMFGRIETLGRAAGQTKIFYKSGQKAVQANSLKAPWGLRMKMAKKRGDMAKEFEIGSEVF